MTAADLRRSRLAAILLLALAVRTWGIGYGLPHVYHQDEPILVHHALAMGAGEWGAPFFVIPPFTQWALLGTYAALFAVGRLAGIWDSAQAFALSFLSDPTLFYLSGRLLLGALAGTATVWVVYRIGRRFFSEGTGGLAALFLALAPMHAQHGHYLYADVPVTLACALVAERAFALVRKPTLRRYAAFGAVLGWAASVKYTALYFAPGLLVLQFAVYGENLVGTVSLRRLLTAAVACLAAFVLSAPTVVAHAGLFWTQMTRQAGAEVSVGPLHHLLYSLAGGTGWLFAAAALAGLVRTPDGGGRRKPVFCLAALFASYWICVSLVSQHFARYALPLVPLACLAAANGWRRLRHDTRVPRWARRAVLALILAELAVPAFYGDWLFTQDDTRDQAKEWVERNLPPGAVLAVDNRFFAPRLPRETGASPEEPAEDARGRLRKMRAGLRARLDAPSTAYRVYALHPRGAAEPPFESLKPLVPADEQGLADASVDWLVLNRTDTMEGVRALVQAHPERYERVAVFSPYRERSDVSSVDPHDSTAAPHLPAELYRRKRLGPYLEVYKVRR